jgi:hypothetical protein
MLGPDSLQCSSGHDFGGFVTALGGPCPPLDWDSQAQIQDVPAFFPKKSSVRSLSVTLGFYKHSWKPCHQQLVPRSITCNKFLGQAYGSLVSLRDHLVVREEQFHKELEKDSYKREEPMERV